jgi:small subunit ribosomal protein S14
MAKVSSIEKNKKRQSLIKKYYSKRIKLKKATKDLNLTVEDRFKAQMKLSLIPRNSSPVRFRNRCNITGRPRSYYRRFGISRIALRDLASSGFVPGLIKASW